MAAKGKVVKKVVRKPYHSDSEAHSEQEEAQTTKTTVKKQSIQQKKISKDGKEKKQRKRPVEEQEEENAEGEENVSSFSSALAKILGKKLKDEDQKAPILAKYKTAELRLQQERDERKKKRQEAFEKRRLKNKDHVILAATDLATTNELERALVRVATRGVVKLFNAVTKHQKEVQTAEAEKQKKIRGPIDKATESNFLSLLKKESANTPTPTAKPAGPAWTRDSYMMGAKMKDWDKEEEEEMEEEMEEEEEEEEMEEEDDE